MKRIYYVLFVVIIILISIECRKELSGENVFPGQVNNQSSPITATLQGNIVDENDQPAEGVVVTVGTETATTNSHGYFRIVDASLDKSASLVTAEQPGYFKAYRTFSATSGVNQVVIKLIRKTLAGTIDAATGGSAALANGGKILLTANGVTTANGAAYTGNINVYASYIDPASNDIGKKVPGSFMGDDKNDKRVVLSSFGMLAVNLESPSGEKLQVAANSTATLTIPIPTSILSSAPASIGLWYIDEQTGIWKEQGTAQKNGNNYIGEVKHFSYWNADFNLPAISFIAILKTSDNVPLANTNVVIRSISDSGGYAHGFTDSLGQVGGLIPANKNLVLEVYDQCYNLVYSKNIGPFAGNTDLGTIIISNAGPSIITIKGKLISCNNSSVSSGYAIIYFNNTVYNVNVNSNGEFLTSIVTCLAIPQTCDILGIDETMQQQGTPITLMLTSQINDAGVISACGSSSEQYINYTLDGKDYRVTNSANDSLVAYSYSDTTNSYGTSFVRGYHSTTNLINFGFSGEAAAGIYPIISLNVVNYNSAILPTPFNVNLTTFPQLAGEFYDGSFSGSFKDSVATTHTITCTFHVRKY